MQTKKSPFLAVRVLKQYGLQASARKLLSKAKKRGTISPEEVAELLPATPMGKRELNKAITKIAEFLDALNISILIERPRKASQKNGHLRKTKPEVPSEQVEVNGLISDGDTVPELVFEEENKDGPSIYYRQVFKYPRLSHEEVVHLSHRVRTRNNTRARNKLVVHNLRLVLKIANWYRGRGLDYDDLVQEGNIGLMTAAERYDGRKGFQFSTYSSWWIRQGIARAVANFCSMIRVPVHAQETGQKILKISTDLFQQLGREPFVEEIAARAGITPERVTQLLNRFKIPVVSFDEIINEDKANTDTSARTNYIPDTKFLKPSRFLEAKEELDEATLDVRFFLALLAELDLSERDKEAFRMYYGLGEDRRQNHTHESIGNIIGVTHQAVWVVIDKVWKKLHKADAVFDQASLIAELERIHSLEDIVGVEAVFEVTSADRERARQVLEAILSTQLPLELSPAALLERESKVLGSKGVSFEQIIKAVEKCSGVSEKQIIEHGRIPKVAHARKIAMYLMREDLEWSLPKIAKKFDGRDHTTVMSNCGKIKALMAKDSPARRMIEQIRADYRGEIVKTAPSRPVNEKADGKLKNLAADLAIGLGATLVTNHGS